MSESKQRFSYKDIKFNSCKAKVELKLEHLKVKLGLFVLRQSFQSQRISIKAI